jgi:hypothetical protein
LGVGFGLMDTKMDMLWAAGANQAFGKSDDCDEPSDVRRRVYDRLVNAALATAVRALIALHDRWWK